MNATTISAYIAKLENENKLLREEVHELNDDAADYRIEIFRLKAVIEDLEEELDEDYESDEESVVSTEDEESDDEDDERVRRGVRRRGRLPHLPERRDRQCPAETVRP